jgi:hypothetical protein
MRTTVALLVLFVITGVSPSAYGQWSTGTGFFINNNGLVLTNHHIFEGGCSNIIVETVSGDKKRGEMLESETEVDLSLIKTNIENERFAYVRMEEGYKRAHQPEKDELVNTLGFPKGEFGPRGGFVDKTRDPRLGHRGFTIGMSTSFGASGSPVLDYDGLLIGIVWGRKNWEDEDGKHVRVYAVDNREILEFLIYNDVKYGASTTEDFPLSKLKDDRFSHKTDKVMSMAIPMIVKLYCKIEKQK